MNSPKTFKGLNIPLIEGWLLKSDVHNIILQSSSGEQFFYADISGALEGLLVKKIKRIDAVSIESLISQLKVFVVGLNDLLSPFKFKVVPLQETLK